MRISQSSILRWGDRRGSSPFRWRSRNQQVPCESLDTFFSQERNCQCGRHEPTKAKTFLKFWFEAECILPPAPNGSLHKTKISLWACAAHSRGYFSFTRKVSKSVSRGLPLRYLLRLKIFQNLLKNGTTVPFLGTMARNFIFPQSITLSRPHSHSVTFPLVYHESFMLLRGVSRGGRAMF